MKQDNGNTCEDLTFGEHLEASRAASDSAASAAMAPLVRHGGNAVMSVAKRSRKDCPRELSFRRPVPVGRMRCLGIFDGGREGHVQPYDPRFESHCGSVNEEHIDRNFSFLDRIREKERAEAKMLLEADPSNAVLRTKVRSMEADESRRRALLRRKAIRSELVAEEKEKVKLGKKPYFVKESAVRERELESKFVGLKAAGGVKKFIEKRRKRLASKDRKLLPQRRARETENSSRF
jgi:ribosomal RNA-processing protein 36